MLSGLAPDTLASLLQQAIDVHVLRQRGSVLEFRHGLIREAVYDDLLPDERTRIHAKFAESSRPRSTARRTGASLSVEPARVPLGARARPGPHPRGVGSRRGWRRSAGSRRSSHPARTSACRCGTGSPTPRTVTGHPQTEILLLLGESAPTWTTRSARYTLFRAAVDMLGPDAGPVARLLVSTPRSPTADGPRRRPVKAGGDSTGGRVCRRLPDRGAGPGPELPVVATCSYINASPTVSKPQRGPSTPPGARAASKPNWMA